MSSRSFANRPFLHSSWFWGDGRSFIQPPSPVHFSVSRERRTETEWDLSGNLAFRTQLRHEKTRGLIEPGYQRFRIMTGCLLLSTRVEAVRISSQIRSTFPFPWRPFPLDFRILISRSYKIAGRKHSVHSTLVSQNNAHRKYCQKRAKGRYVSRRNLKVMS